MLSRSDKSLSTHFHHLANQMDLVATVVMQQRNGTAFRELSQILLRLGEGMRQLGTHLQQEEACPDSRSDTDSTTDDE